MKIAQFLKAGQVVRLTLDEPAASAVWGGQAGDYATVEDHDSDGVLVVGHRMNEHGESVPTGSPVYVSWAHVFAIRTA
jgi:hypothetical protein